MMRRLLLAAALAALAPWAAAQDTIKIAVLGPMSYVQGQNHWMGAELARDDINKAGGVNVGGKKMKIELIQADTNEIKSVPDAANAVERVITHDKADFLVGGFRSEAVLAMQEVAMDGKKIFLGCGAADGKLGDNVKNNYDRYKYWFRVTPTKAADLGKTLFTVLASIAGQIRKDLGKPKPKVAILAEKVVWTGAIVKAAQANLPKMGMEVVGTWQPSAVASDLTAELSAIERAGADIIFTAVSGPAGIVLGRQMGERKMKAIAFGINVEAQKDGFWQATAGKANFVSTLDTYGMVEVTPKMIPFVKEFEARFGKSPTYNAATYDAIQMLKEAIEATGGMDNDKIIKYFEGHEFIGTSGDLKFDDHHDPIWGIGKTSGIAVEWQDGKKVPFWPQNIKGMKPFLLP